MAIWVLLPQILKPYRSERVGGDRGWGNIVASSSCYFVKEKHQTQPIELKCLAHEICDSVGEGCFGSVFI